MTENNHNHEQGTDRPEAKTPEHLERAIVVIDVKAWIALATVLLVVAATAIWAFFGTMHVREDVAGVLVRSGRVMNIYAPETSTILDLTIERDQQIERDQVVARLDQTALVNEINALIDAGGDEAAIEALRKDLVERSQIRVADAGRVEDVFVHEGDYVSSGTRIATVLQAPREGSSLQCLLFVPSAQMKNLAKNMHVNVYPVSANRNEYGNMVGTIAQISEYPVTYNYLLDLLGSDALARQYTDGAAYYEVIVNLVASEETPTGYLWTTSSGPGQAFGNLTLCDASIILDELRPVDVFFKIGA